MSARRPGTLIGDQWVYAGRECIGFVRGTVGGSHAYDPAGSTVGTFSDRRAAIAALTARAAAQKGAKE